MDWDAACSILCTRENCRKPSRYLYIESIQVWAGVIDVPHVMNLDQIFLGMGVQASLVFQNHLCICGVA